ncbi:MAG: TlpA disulfide reductase family protein [Bacteroidota bacterium]
MLRTFAYVVPFLLAPSVWAQTPAVFSPTERPSPGFQVFEPDGGVLTNQAYSGNVLVLTFWASWCSPCLRELPHLQALHEAYADDDRVAVLAINIGEGEPEVEATRFWTNTAYTMPYAYDRTSFIYATFGATAIPATYIIDSAGTIRYEAYGIGDGDAYEAEVRGYVDALLGG